ncbi:uncharacterized protein LOC130549461, partial [Triplophysa rosa]|uniref:uncharacterized protein LOC130549461 n=1 Tax=Triplophysa rosa TaxID=992332 RepID=UPI002545F005
WRPRSRQRRSAHRAKGGGGKATGNFNRPPYRHRAQKTIGTGPRDLKCKLQEAETLLKRAETKLKEREAKAKASKRHFQAARAEVQALAQQQDQLKAEFDTVQRELKYAYQAEQSGGKDTTESPPTSWNRLPSLHRTPTTTHVMAPKDIDKLARNIPMFTPNPAGGHDVHAYVQDIDFHLETMVNVSTRDRLYLLRITSSREVRSFLDRQSDTVKRDYKQLQQVIIKEFSDPESEQGLVAAMDLKQGRLETPPAYYNRLRQTYIGARNEPEMEEDFNFRTLFLRSLHPSVSHHLGDMACPRTMTTQQLRDMAHKAYVKHKTTSEKTVKNPVIFPVSEHYPELTLEGAKPHHSARPGNRETRDFTATEWYDYLGARAKHPTGHPERPRGRPRWSDDPRDSAAWETNRRPRRHRPAPAGTTSPNSHLRNAPQRPRDKPNSHLSPEQKSTETSESAEILKILKELIQKGPNKPNEEDMPDSS